MIHAYGAHEPRVHPSAFVHDSARVIGDVELGSEPLTYSSGEGTIPLRELARFPFAVRGFDVAVAPGDGIARLAVTDGEKIYLYRISEEKLEPEWTYPVRAFGTIFSLQLADLDGDGVLEVIVGRHHYSATHTVGMAGFILATHAARRRSRQRRRRGDHRPQNLPQPGLLAVVYRGPTGYRLQSVNSGFEGTILGLGAIPGERPTLLAAVAQYKGALQLTGETQIIVTVQTD